MARILFLVTEDWYFLSHRLPLARAARERGHDVIVVTRVNRDGERIRSEGFRLVPVEFSRGARKPFRDLLLVLDLIGVFRRERPDLVHNVALKPVLFGSVAAFVARTPHVVNALTGLGYVYISRRWRARAIRIFLRMGLGFLLRRRNTWVILQNGDDRSMLLEQGMLSAERTVIIRGSGVDTDTFSPSPEPSGRVSVVLASRMLYDKGVAEFVEAAASLRAAGTDARFVLVGGTDPDNPAAIEEHALRQWQADGLVEWLGRSEDMPALFRSAHIVCLPSYREGLPKVLLEAAASGRPIVAADVPGCREIVRDGENGLLVPVRDSGALASALAHLIARPALRRQMGDAGRQLAVSQFSIRNVVSETLAFYDKVLETG